MQAPLQHSRLGQEPVQKASQPDVDEVGSETAQMHWAPALNKMAVQRFSGLAERLQQRVVQRAPKKREQDAEVLLETYQDVLDFLEEDPEDLQGVLAEVVDPQGFVEWYIDNSDDVFDSPEALEDDLAYWLDAEEEGEDEGIDYEELYQKEMQPRNKRTSKKRNHYPSPKPSRQEVILDKFAGMSGGEKQTDLNPIDDIQEAVFSNLYQGRTDSDFQGKRKKLGEAKKFLETTLRGKGDAEARNYKVQLEKTRKAILDGEVLVRKMSVGESQAYTRSGGKTEAVFRQGSEGMKAFRIDEVYVFQSAERNKKAGDYEMEMQIRLTAKLKTYFINYLSANIGNPLGVQDKEMHFGFNPQFKFESGGVTILIPSSGWMQFWSFVDGNIVIRELA